MDQYEYGFRTRKGNFRTASAIIEKQTDRNKVTYLAFIIDLEKAFDQCRNNRI